MRSSCLRLDAKTLLRYSHSFAVWLWLPRWTSCMLPLSLRNESAASKILVMLTKSAWQFTHFSQLRFLARLYFTIWHSFSTVLGSPTPCYASVTFSHSLPSGYMILEYLDQSVGKRMSFNDLRNETKRLSLFRNISRIFLALSRHPQPCIGSYKLGDDCDVRLTNRPLTAEIMILENQGAPQTIARDEAYTCADAYISDLITFHDKRFLSNPNALGLNMTVESGWPQSHSSVPLFTIFIPSNIAIGHLSYSLPTSTLETS